MEDLMFAFVNRTKPGPPTYINHSCHRFVVPEDLRPQDLSHTSDERDASTPPRQPMPYSWQLPFSTPKDDSLVPVPTTPSPLTSPISQSSSPSSWSSGSSSLNIKQEPSSPAVYDTYRHPFSVESLIGDILDRKGDPSRPAEVFSSTYINVEINRYIACQSMLASFYSKPGLSPIQNRSEYRPLQNNSTRNVVYWCHTCNALCTNTTDAVRHRQVHETNGETCRLRSTIYKEHGCVTTHERQGDDRIQCGLCDKSVSHCFFSKHQRLHEGHFCEECGKEFSTNSRLQDHKNTHTGKTPYTCTICDRHFSKRSSWTQHQRYHRDHRSFMCQFCKKRFNSKYACAVHERLHTGENPYQCAYPGCNRTYPQKIQLKLHMNTHR